MFGVKNHVNDLQYSQRFYYTNYQFYNDYDNPKDYSNDISKVHYSCRRKTIPTITKYHHKAGTGEEENRSIRTTLEFADEQTTMEQFLEAFTNTFQQNNYSDLSETVEEQRKNSFRIAYFPSEVYLRIVNNFTQKKSIWKKSQNSFEIINVLMDIQKETITNIMELNRNEEISNEDLDYYRNLLGFSELSYLAMYAFLKKEEDGVRALNSFNHFRVLIQDIISSIMESESCSHEILYIPNISMFSYFLNPALCIIKNFLIKSESYSKSQTMHSEAFQQEIPRIAFINLDGIENPLNLEYLRSFYSNNLLYVTIFKEYEDITEVNDEVSNWFSKFLAKLIYNCNHKSKHNGTQQKVNSIGCPKVMAFPLSSSYVKSKHEQNSQYDNIYLSGSSVQISFLFENSIYQEIRLFNPHIIFISYNGVLSIQESHFNQIVRRLTVLSDHKIILFPNLANLFAKTNQISTLVEKIITSQNQMEMDLKRESQVSDLVNLAKFVEDYSSFEISNVDVNQFFNNLAMFNKITSGAYSFNQKRNTKSYEKFEVEYKLKYLEMLAKLDEFSYLQKYCSQNIKVNALGKLLAIQRDGLLKANNEQAKFFSHFIDKTIKNMAERPGSFSTKIRIRMAKMWKSLQLKHQDVLTYLEKKKKSILIQSITREKITKVFTIPRKIAHEAELKDVLALELYLTNSKGDKEKILLDPFSQVIIDPQSSVIICTNYIDKMFSFCWLYGIIQAGKREVEMFIFKREEYQNVECLYFQYSIYFCQANDFLYMYWPYEWNVQEEIASLLLDIKYEPKIVHKMVVISYKSLQSNSKELENFYLELREQNMQRYVKPRFGSTMYHNNGLLYIFGGYHDDRDDFGNQGSGVSIARIDFQNRMFLIEDIGKSVLVTRLRPKANYTIQKISDKLISLEGGYGREFTNYYNVYSYNRYIFNLQTHYLQAEYSPQRKLNALNVPMSTNKLGRFEAVTFEYDTPQPVKLGTSHKTKHRFIMKTNNNKVLSFINDEYSTTTHKENDRTQVLFDINRKITNIYTHTHCSPEIFIRRTNIGNEVNNSILRIELLTQLASKPKNCISSNLVFPSEDSLTSLCIHPSNHIIYILAQSPLYTNQIDILYQAKLENVSDILHKKEIVFKKYFEFSPKYYNVKDKSLVCIGGGIGVFGGDISHSSFRQDYILDQLRGVVRARTIKFIYEDEPQILTMNNSYIVLNPQKDQEEVILYSLNLDEENHWQLKLQTICLTSQKSVISVSHLATCTIINNCMRQFQAKLKNPAIVSIEKYYILNLEVVRNQYNLLMRRIEQIMQTNEYFKEDKQILDNIAELLMDVLGNLNKIYENMVKYGEIICFNVSRYGEYPELQEFINDILCSIVTLHMEQICLKVIHNPELKQLYRFYIEDKKYPLVKYIGISELNTNNIVFFRIKFNKNVAINLKNLSEHATTNACWSALYGCNLAKYELNKIVFSDEEFMDKFTQGSESVSLEEEIEPFETEVQQYEVTLSAQPQSQNA